VRGKAATTNAVGVARASPTDLSGDGLSGGLSVLYFMATEVVLFGKLGKNKVVKQLVSEKISKKNTQVCTPPWGKKAL
jgi:hypothetical protein